MVWQFDRHNTSDRAASLRHDDGHACLGDPVEQRQAALLELTCRNTRFLLPMESVHGHIIALLSRGGPAIRKPNIWRTPGSQRARKRVVPRGKLPGHPDAVTGSGCTVP